MDKSTGAGNVPGPLAKEVGRATEPAIMQEQNQRVSNTKPNMEERVVIVVKTKQMFTTIVMGKKSFSAPRLKAALTQWLADSHPKDTYFQVLFLAASGDSVNAEEAISCRFRDCRTYRSNIP